MNPPDGATIKPWGWQKQVYADDEREVWIGFGKAGGRTSMHRHDQHSQEVSVLVGRLAITHQCAEPMVMPHREFVTWSQQRHQLKFVEDCLFTEHYLKLPGAPPVTEDTIREAE